MNNKINIPEFKVSEFNRKFKDIIEKNKSSYEEMIDKTTKSIENFIKSAAVDVEKKVQ